MSQNYTELNAIQSIFEGLVEIFEKKPYDIHGIDIRDEEAVIEHFWKQAEQIFGERGGYE